MSLFNVSDTGDMVQRCWLVDDDTFNRVKALLPGSPATEAILPVAAMAVINAAGDAAGVVLIDSEEGP